MRFLLLLYHFCVQQKRVELKKSKQQKTCSIQAGWQRGWQTDGVIGAIGISAVGVAVAIVAFVVVVVVCDLLG